MGSIRVNLSVDCTDIMELALENTTSEKRDSTNVESAKRKYSDKEHELHRKKPDLHESYIVSRVIYELCYLESIKISF